MYIYKKLRKVSSYAIEFLAMPCRTVKNNEIIRRWVLSRDLGV